MADKRLKRLANLRLALSGIALLLAVLMVVSGIMCFLVKRPSVPETPPETTVSQQETTMEPTESGIPNTMPIMPDENGAEGDPGHHKDQKGPGDGANDSNGNPNETNPNPGDTGHSGDSNSENADTSGGDSNASGTGGETPSNDGSSGETPINDGSSGETPSNDGSSGDTGVDTVNADHDAPGKKEHVSTDTQQETHSETTDFEGAEASNQPSDDDDSIVFTRPAEVDGEQVTTGPEETASEETASEETEPIETAAPQDVYDIPEPTVMPTAEPEPEKPGPNPWAVLFWASAALLAADLAAILVLSRCIEAERKNREVSKPPAAAHRKLQQVPVVGTVHQVGRRDYQQDSLGHSAVLGGKGMLAVLADGMGGLSGGDKISQQIVMKMLTLGQQLKPGQTGGILRKMLAQVNEEVNRMLGPDGLYKSGSTMVAVLIQGREFQWISVGDSRIYLYRQGYANQLNRDHDQLQVWMAEVLEGKRSCEEAMRNPDGRKLTSFIGMGQLKQVDASLSAIELEPGDRLVLMSDGIYNVLSEERLAAVLKQYPDVNQAAAVIERLVREAQNPYQDNYTAMILGF